MQLSSPFVNPPPRVSIAKTSSEITLLAGLGVIAALYFGRAIFVPLALALLISFVLAPLVRQLIRLGTNRVLAVLVVVIIFFGVILGLGLIVGQQVVQLADKLPQYEQSIKAKIESFRGPSGEKSIFDRASGVFKNLKEEIQQPNQQTGKSEAPLENDKSAKEHSEKPIRVEVQEPDPTPLELLRRALSPLLDSLATGGIVVIFVFFMLIERDHLRNRLIRLAGSSDLQRTTDAMNDAANRLSHYLLTQTALNASFGVIVATGLWLIGIPTPVVWGLLAALLRFVPYIGAFIAAAFPVALALAIDPTWFTALWTAGLFIVVEPIVGQLVEPVVYGRSTGLSPLAVIVTTVFWTWLWGPIGLLLSTPLTTCLGVLGRHVPHLEFLDVLFGDQAPLTPAQCFYQGALISSSDQLTEQAENILKEKSLLTYYDEVALTGLKLAHLDARRGVIDNERNQKIRDTVQRLVGDLSDYDDVTPPKPKLDARPADRKEEPNPPSSDLPILNSAEAVNDWRSDLPVICVAGRGPLDEPISAMLAQTLVKHGINADSATKATFFSSKDSRFENAEIALVCLSYLDIDYAPARLRQSVLLLRRKLPRAKILIGLWGREGNPTPGEDLGIDAGADFYALSLRDTIRICLDAARGIVPNGPAAVDKNKSSAEILISARQQNAVQNEIEPESSAAAK